MRKIKLDELSPDTLDMFASLPPGTMITGSKRAVQKVRDFIQAHEVGKHWPHPAERSKAERMAEEIALKGEPPTGHPGREMYLCQSCGTWHKQGEYGIDTRESR